MDSLAFSAPLASTFAQYLGGVGSALSALLFYLYIVVTPIMLHLFLFAGDDLRLPETVKYDPRYRAINDRIYLVAFIDGLTLAVAVWAYWNASAISPYATALAAIVLAIHAVSAIYSASIKPVRKK